MWRADKAGWGAPTFDEGLGVVAKEGRTLHNIKYFLLGLEGGKGQGGEGEGWLAVYSVVHTSVCVCLCVFVCV